MVVINQIDSFYNSIDNFYICIMTLQQLEYIVAVHKEKNFSKAADKCFVTQPTLSMQIHKFEEVLGAVIFDRSKQPVVATALGMEIIAIAQDVLKDTRRIQELVEDAKGQISGDLRIGIIPTVAPYLVPMFLTGFLEQYPNVNLILEEMPTDDIVRNLKMDLLDAGILVTPLSDLQIHEKPLYYEPFVAYVSPSSEMYAHNMLSPKDMDLSEIWLLNEGHCMQSQVINLCYERKKRRLVPNFEYRAGSIETLRKMVELNEGATLLPELALRDLQEHQMKMVRRFEDPQPVREVSMVTHRNYVKKGLLNALLNSIKACIPEDMQHIEGKNRIAIQ